MNKTMIQRLMHSVMLLAAAVLLLVACQQDEFLGSTPAVKEGYVALHFTADVPVMEVVETRSVDPDGGGVQNMTLFCFDRYGLFITTATGKLAENAGINSGTFYAQVPENTRIVHFVANQVMSTFPQNHFLNKSEAEVMALLEGSSGRMIYWARFACQRDKDESISKQLAAAGNKIVMLRNHAKVSVSNPTNQWFTVTGFAVYNTNAFGTVAPYHPEKGFDFTDNEWKNTDFITLPENRAKLSDVTDVTTAQGRYIFECENSLKDPVSVILKGRNNGDTQERYYRVMLMQDGEQILLRRNHDYQINIAGPLSFGQDTFAEALEAAATNNVWISISDKVNEVEDKDYILTVDKTDYVIDAEQGGHPYTLTYTIKGKNQTQLTEDDIAEVTWIDNQVARQQIENIFTPDDGKGEITINLLPLGGNDKLEGTLLVKKGRLQRKIKVVMVKRQSFAPSWIGTEIYGGMNQSDPTKDRSHLTVMFTIPENCPAELFPIKTYISVGDLDIRPESGMALTVVRSGEKEWYSSGTITPEPDYKYLFVAEKPGVHRVYFENILAQKDDYKGTLYIEAEHFVTMERTFTYSSSRKSITVTGLKAYNAIGGGVEGMSDDELILYRLVPQKRNASVSFNLQLYEKTGDGVEHDNKGKPFNAQQKDEFMLYSQYLNYYREDVESSPFVKEFDCKFYPDESATWSALNNPLGGRMLMFKPINPANPAETGKYVIYMYTNRPRSEEVIRIASNRRGMPAVLKEDASSDGLYAGNSYRSVTFELANYNPFRFGSKMKYGNGEFVGYEPNREVTTASIPEEITPMTWTYEPGIPVDIAIDVTSFKGSDDNSVDPFGEDFDIFIDAPMLKLAKNDGLDGQKLREVSPGRFAYKVEADREQERKFFSNSGLNVTNVDKTTGVNQTGERKLLHFETKDIVSAGDIVISSDEERVVFYTKTFRIQNESIKGVLKYRTETGEQVVPNGAFVAFEKETDGSRIGSISVGANGLYELRLRKEYDFSWINTKVLFHYERDAVVYQATFENLDALFKNTQPIVLTAKPKI